MSVITIDPKSADRPYLKSGGEYGNGRTYNCDVELIQLEVPALKGPGFDRDCNDHQYCKFLFRVNHDEMGSVLVNHWEPTEEGSGSKALQYLHSIAPESVDLETGSFDPETIAPRACAIEVKDPREDKNGNWWTGNVTNVFGV